MCVTKLCVKSLVCVTKLYLTNLYVTKLYLTNLYVTKLCVTKLCDADAEAEPRRKRPGGADRKQEPHTIYGELGYLDHRIG